MCLLGYVDQVFAKHIYICGLVYSTFKFVMLAIFVVNAFHCNNMKNCVIVTKFVLLPEIHCHNTIFCHNNKTVLAVNYINNTYIILYTTAIATYWFSKLELWICFILFLPTALD